MNSVILATDQAVTLQDLLVRLQIQWPKLYINPLGNLVVEDGDNRVYICLDNDAHEEYSPEELQRIVKLMPAPRFFAIDYSSGEFVRRVLLAIADDPKVLVDNNAGTVLPGPEFVRRLRNEPSWDWFEEFRRNHPRDNRG